MSGPTDNPRRGENRREQVGGNAERSIEDRREEIDVGGDPLCGKTLSHGGLHGEGHREPPITVVFSAEAVRDVTENRRPRVHGSIDPMAKSHHPLAGIEKAIHVVFRLRRRADLLEHRHHPFVGTTMKRPRERADRSGDRRVKIRKR